MIQTPIQIDESDAEIISVCRDHTDSVLPLSATQMDYDPVEQCVTQIEVTREGEYPYGEYVQSDEFTQWMSELATIVEEIYTNETI